MTLLWPWLLLLLLLVPLLIAAYVWMLRRRRRYVVHYSSLLLVRQALPRRARWRQHLPFALFTLGLTSLILTTARPAAVVEVPLSRTTIILALDVSRSMCSTDVAPNRLSVAQEAALAFIEAQETGTQIGIVAFAGFAEIIVPPTADKDRLTEAVENLTTSLGTAIGSATLKAIDAVAEINPAVAPSGVNLRGDGAPPPPPEGIYQPEIIVLLTDGANSQGPQPLDAAERAALRGLRVYTIGFGTPEGGAMVCTRRQLGSDAFGDGFGGFGGGFGPGGGGAFRRLLVIDEPTLQAVADTTGGAYFRAENADQLYEVFRTLPAQIVLQTENLELSVLFALLGAIFAGAGVVLSLLWNRFP
ncbi:MAG: VWA domain-containing protein [Anaerolineales bacterium]|nr:VWA domain-containing protein [Anaerolineales bacterium]